MKKNSLHKGQHVLVVGAGKSGMAACRLLKSKGCKVCLTDGRERSLQDKEDLLWLDANAIVQEFGGHHLRTFMLADLIVVSPGVPLSIAPLEAARKAAVPIIGELELGFSYFAGEIVAVTGTNGKTTVTTMIGEALEKSGKTVFVGGNIGTPLCTHVLLDEQAGIAVLEVSSFQLDSIGDFRPRVGLLLNISPDHLDRYDSYKAYGDSKMRLFENQQDSDVALICATDAEVMQRKGLISSTVVEFDDDNWQVNGEQKSLTWLKGQPVAETYELHPQQLSRPNVQNCMAAISASRLMGATRDGVQQMLSGFAIPLHRLTTIGSWGGVDFVNDSKATNIGAVQSALAGMTRPVILIAGGRDKGGDYGLLNLEVQRIVKTMILLGEAAEKMQESFSNITRVIRAASMDDAVKQAVAEAVAGDIVLLSPACASFDMYASYNERGDTFMQAVQQQVLGMGKSTDASSKKSMQRAV